MSAKYVLLTSAKYRRGTSALTMTTRKVTFEGSFVETVMASKVRYTIWHVGELAGGARQTSYKEFYLIGRNTHRRVLTQFFTRLIRQPMKSDWTVTRKHA